MTHGLQPARPLYPWDFPGENSGVVAMPSSRGASPDPGVTRTSPALQADALPVSHGGSPGDKLREL